MAAPASDSHLQGTKKRLAAMTMGGLLTEWEKRLFESERILLIEEPRSRGYRMKSLTPPDDDSRDPVEQELDVEPGIARDERRVSDSEYARPAEEHYREGERGLGVESAVGWWSRRFVLFNLGALVAVVGAFVVYVALVVKLGKVNREFEFSLVSLGIYGIPAVAYVVVANACLLLAAALELIVPKRGVPIGAGCSG